MRGIPSGPVQPGDRAAERRRLLLYVAGSACGVLLVTARAVFIAGGPQLVVSVLAALGFGAAAVLILRLAGKQSSVRAQLLLGLGVAAAIFASWFYFIR